jgi:hypothetical protein
VFGANPAMLPPLVEQGRQSYVDVLLGKGHFQEIENTSRCINGQFGDANVFLISQKNILKSAKNSGMQTLKGVEGFGGKEARTLLGNHTVQAGDDSLKTITAVLGGVSDF